MKTEFNITLNPKLFYRFNMKMLYLSFQGFLAIAIPIFCFVVGGFDLSKALYQVAAVYIGCGLLFLLYMPISMWLRSKKLFKEGAPMTLPLTYTISEEKIVVKQGSEYSEATWDQVYKLNAGKRGIEIFTGRRNACLLPKEQMGEAYDTVVEIATKQLPKYRLNVKKQK